MGGVASLETEMATNNFFFDWGSNLEQTNDDNCPQVIAPLITTVIDVGKGWIKVELQDGTHVRRSEGTVSWRCNNPGNLKFTALTIGFGAVGKDYGGHAIFANLDAGCQAQYTLLFRENGKYIKLTIAQMINKYAPASDGNDPQKYIDFIVKHTGFTPDAVLADLDSVERSKLLDVMTMFEGFKRGAICEI